MTTLYGQLSTDGNPTINQNAYHSNRQSKGKYQVQFESGTFKNEPSICLTLVNDGGGSTGKTIAVTSADASQFTCAVQNNNGDATDFAFNFIVVGA